MLSRRDPDVTATKVYFPEGQVQAHQQETARCSPELVAGYYWYGTKKYSTGGVPKLVDQFGKGHAKDATASDLDLSLQPGI